MISAVYSLFSGVLRGGSVCRESDEQLSKIHTLIMLQNTQLWSYQKKVVIFRFCPQILEDDLLHKSLHQVPVLHYPVTDRPLKKRRRKMSQNLRKSHLAHYVQTSCLLHLCCIRWFVDGFVPDEEVQVVDALHHPALGLVSHLGWFFDCDTWRWSENQKNSLERKEIYLKV